MQVRAKVVRVLPKETVGQYTKRRIHIVYAENPLYPNTLELEAFGTRSDIYDGLSEGMEADFFYDPKGREYEKNGETRVYVTLSGYKVENVTGGSATAVTTAAKPQQVSPAIVEDDLPF